jgi:putative flippase GtrA
MKTPTSRQFVKYGFAGATAVLVHFLVLAALVEWFSVHATLATGVGFVVGCLVNYALQYRWVFGATGAHRALATRYALVTSVTFVLNILLFHALLTGFYMWYGLAQAIATIVVFLVNFEINRRYTFAS